MVGSIVVVGVLTCCALLNSVCNLKGAQINIQCNLIQELMLYKFKLVHNATEATKNICCAKGKGAVDHSSVTRGFKKFRLGCKNLDDQARLDRPKAVLQAIEANLVSSTWRVSGELDISQFSIVHYLYDLKTFRAAEVYLTLPKYCKTYNSPK